MVTTNKNPFFHLADAGIDVSSLKRLLNLIDAPGSLLGLSDAITNMFASAQAIGKLGHESKSLPELYQLLYLLDQNKSTFVRALDKIDRNSMRGHYEDYPLYSVFTQNQSSSENPESTRKFLLISGLLLVSIWVGNEPWKPVPKGFKKFLDDLRLVRKEGRFSELSFIPDECASLQHLIEAISTSAVNSPLAQKARKLALDLQQRLSVSNTGMEDVSVRGADYSRQDSERKPRDYGNADEWKLGGRRIRRPVVTERPNVIAPRKVVLRAPPSNLPGVDQAETERDALLIEAPPVQNADELPEKNTQVYYGLEARYATESDNQFLPYTWEVLNEHEVSTLVSAVVASLQSGANAKGALVVGLAIITSRTPADLAKFLIIPGAPFESVRMPAFFPESACWYSPFPDFERFTPTNEQSRWLNPTGDGCLLPLPVELHAALMKYGLDGKTLGTALESTAEDLERLAGDFCRAVRLDARSRVNVSWLRGIMFHRMHALSKDDVGTIATLGNTEHAPGIGLFYATFEQSKWQAIYSEAVSSIGLTPTQMEDATFLPFGSRQLPDPDKMREWIHDLGQQVDKQCRNAKGLPEVVAAHNMISCYTFLMALAGSGHRPSVSYTFGPSSLDLQNGWALISDKITSPTTRIRLIPLSDMLIRQFTNYETHLHNLSARLFDSDYELATRINALVTLPRRMLLPFFFVLDEYLNATAIDIATVVEITGFPYEGNAFRHFLATGLRNQGCTAEHIAILLAHIETGQYGFGKFSALSPVQWKESIIGPLSKVLEEQGWIPVSGLRHLRKSLPDFEQYRKALQDMSDLDVFGKASIHQDVTAGDRQVVREAFVAAKAATPRGSPGDEFLNAFRTEIINRSVDAPDRLGRRLNYLVRFVRLHRHALQPSMIPGWSTDLNVEDAVFQPDTLLAASSAAWYRNKLSHLAEDFESLGHTEQVALIVVSSILMGALLRESLVKELPIYLNSAHALNGLVWIDFKDSISGGIQRWFADQATALLIARYKSMNNKLPPTRSGKLRAAVSGLLKKTDPDKDHVRQLQNLQDLLHASRSYFTLHLPGLVRAFACGDVKSVSLTEGAWLRVLTGRPLRPAIIQESTPRETSINPHAVGGENQSSAKRMYKKILNAISKEFPAAASGAKSRKGERKNRRAALSSNLNKLMSESGDMPSVFYAILAWAYHQATEGTVGASNPSIGTIYTYVTDITRPLVEFGSDCDFLELSDAELTDIYQRVIDYGSEKEAVSRAQSLRWFHEFCEEEFDVPELDWGEIFQGLTVGNSRVSANILTFGEYLHAKRLLGQHPALGKRGRQMHVVALVLLYRCGIRMGELMRITVSDLVLNIRNVLLVRNGIYGKTKTRAGIRQIPWLDRLDDEELSLLKDWLDHRISVAKNDPWGALFGEAEEARTLEVRHHLSRTITSALRQVTGDPAIKIHHMRHGAGTSALSLALATRFPGLLARNGADWFSSKDKNNLTEEFHEFHLGNSSPTRRIVWAISQALGHTSPRTTVWHYGHSLDLALHENVSQHVNLKNAEVSRLSGMNQNLLNVTVHKGGGKSAYRVALSWILRDRQENDLLARVEDVPFSDVAMSPPPMEFLTSTKLVHLILTDILNGFGTARIANRYVRDDGEIKAIVGAAAKIERMTGYRSYRRENVIEYMNKGDKLSKLMTGNAVALMPKFKEAFDNQKKFPILVRGIEAWERCYEANQSGLRIPYAEDLDAIVAMLEILGIEEKQIILAGNSPEAIDELRKNSKFQLKNFGIAKRAESYRTNRRTPLGMKKAPTLLVASTSTSEMGNNKIGQSLSMKKLHHQLFLAAVLVAARRQFYGDQSIRN